jgi:hypothetical protein
MLNQPWRKGSGQRTKLSAPNSQEINTGKKAVGNKPPPKTGQVVDHRTDLLNQEAAFKTKLPHLTGGGADQIALAEG